MVELFHEDIQTKEVLGWKGQHLFHAPLSSCSQKIRIFLNLKNISWQSHRVQLHLKENLSPYFLGINPRGLVPVLIDDGAVHIESNDILLHLEHRFPDPPLIPPERRAEVESLLRFEDDLHLDLRTLSFRYLFAPAGPVKSAADLERYATTGSGTVRGRRDDHREREIGFWKNMNRSGITDQQSDTAVKNFHAALEDLDARISRQGFILGDTLSVVDIAWVVYLERLRLCGYPLQRLHSSLWRWHAELSGRPEFASELALPPEMASAIAARQEEMASRGASLEAAHFAARQSTDEPLPIHG